METETDTAAAPANGAEETGSQRPGSQLPRGERPDIRKPGEEREGTALVGAAAKGDKLSDGEHRDALAWFLSDEVPDSRTTVEINVGTRDEPIWVNWTLQAIGEPELNKIRQSTSGGRASRRRGGEGQIDDGLANAQIVLAGTAYPNLAEAAVSAGLQNPVAALRRKFAHKPGLIGQLAGEVMSISGFDDDDLREVSEVEAARN